MLLLVLVISPALALAGCSNTSTGPGEDALLPAAQLRYPGSTEIKRHFFAATEGQTVDGTDDRSDASLDITATLEEPIPPGELLGWFQDQLEAQGWTEPYLDENQIRIYQQVDGVRHQFVVQPGEPDADSHVTEYSIDYRMSSFDPDD